MLNKQDVDVVQKEITTIINPTKKVKDLEDRLAFSDTFQNKIDLADAYFEINDYANAAKHYGSALEGFHKNDFYTLSQLAHCLYYQKSYTELVSLIEPYTSHPEFQKSPTQFRYGLSLEHLDRIEEAETHLVAIDTRYSFYEKRLQLAQFYARHNNEQKASVLITTLSEEVQNMTKMNRKKYHTTISQIQKLQEELST